MGGARGQLFGLMHFHHVKGLHLTFLINPFSVTTLQIPSIFDSLYLYIFAADIAHWVRLMDGAGSQ